MMALPFVVEAYAQIGSLRPTALYVR